VRRRGRWRARDCRRALRRAPAPRPRPRRHRGLGGGALRRHGQRSRPGGGVVGGQREVRRLSIELAAQHWTRCRAHWHAARGPRAQAPPCSLYLPPPCSPSPHTPSAGNRHPRRTAASCTCLGAGSARRRCARSCRRRQRGTACRGPCRRPRRVQTGTCRRCSGVGAAPGGRHCYARPNPARGPARLPARARAFFCCSAELPRPTLLKTAHAEPPRSVQHKAILSDLLGSLGGGLLAVLSDRVVS
jgi:hypothetical protein